jgi:hypothetical protein
VDGFGNSAGRQRNGRPISGVAQPRGENDLISFPFYGPWGSLYPYVGSGFGYGLGYVTYDPWRYGATGWVWGRNGLWYDPFSYNPYGFGGGYGGYYDPYGYGGGYSSSMRDEEETYEPRRVGSLRLRANPKEAKVYIDGALVGTVDEFDGLSDHLELEAGPHQLELKADGYQTYSGTINVPVGKTMTERVKMKKQ